MRASRPYIVKYLSEQNMFWTDIAEKQEKHILRKMLFLRVFHFSR
jgi:hypothetical protein